MAEGDQNVILRQSLTTAFHTAASECGVYPRDLFKAGLNDLGQIVENAEGDAKAIGRRSLVEMSIGTDGYWEPSVAQVAFLAVPMFMVEQGFPKPAREEMKRLYALHSSTRTPKAADLDAWFDSTFK